MHLGPLHPASQNKILRL